VNIPILAIVIPCYNEEEIVEATCSRVNQLLSRLVAEAAISHDSFICFVDDGSSDGTWDEILRLCASSASTFGIKLSRNFGHQNALLAGLTHARKKSDCIISIDADLQQDEEAIPLFLEEFNKGADVVYGIRNSRDTDGIFKRLSANFFYGLMNILGVQIKKNHADYRLLSQRAVQALEKYDENNLFLRGIIPSIGFKQATVHFSVKDRELGKSKYTLGKMIGFALDGITSFSITPLRFVTVLGFLFTVFSGMMLMYILIMSVVYETAIPGWASQVLPIYLLGGIQLLALGIIGEYIGRIYMESKHRPRYIVEASNLE